MSLSKTYSIPQNVNSRTPAFWVGPQRAGIEIIGDEIFLKGELYAKKIADKNRDIDKKKVKKEHQIEEKPKEEKPKEDKPKEEKLKKDKNKEETEKKISTDMFMDTLGERSRIWGDIYCTVSNNKNILEKPILLFETNKPMEIKNV
uniref:Uncharacterized protein n=1 Tax=viral metagenome TaxID=1070528 RepID=A0A6C0HSY8_9ZZZZ